MLQQCEEREEKRSSDDGTRNRRRVGRAGGHRRRHRHRREVLSRDRRSRGGEGDHQDGEEEEDLVGRSANLRHWSKTDDEEIRNFERDNTMEIEVIIFCAVWRLEIEIFIRWV